LTTLMVSVTVLVTIVLSLGLGIGLGYVAVMAVLRAFSPTNPKPASRHLSAAEVVSGGD
jgi:hypothetical protein